jgi:hypothetical protein
LYFHAPLESMFHRSNHFSRPAVDHSQTPEEETRARESHARKKKLMTINPLPFSPHPLIRKPGLS